MPNTYTPEQIISVKWHIRSLERTDIIPKEARIPPYEDRHGQDWALENEALIILAALEAAEKERDALADGRRVQELEEWQARALPWLRGYKKFVSGERIEVLSALIAEAKPEEVGNAEH
jgi:hypothetical protein